ncbi:CBASS oligonucleotide cyclase [Candidatus Spongiihabitans sp.]|uniref:CBASS oligonucleotide cyclase n=1 Tax=Candidatus Spongiihabitans sp. TaxID=3101308 RepID=UPI003C6F64B4
MDKKLNEDSNFKLRRMLLSGSLAKRTALKNLNDIDVALYILQPNPPDDMPKFLDDLVNMLKTLYSNMEPSQIQKQEHSIRISYRGTGLDVDLVPIAYDDNGEWNGYLYSSRSGEWVKTNIKKHLEFIGKRKKKHDAHYVQVIRLLKYWIKETKKNDESFRFKSFLVELIVAHLADNGKICLDDYVEALADFFNFIVRGKLDEIIVFPDYYPRSSVSRCSDQIRVFDPVNPGNNVASNYTFHNKKSIADAAADAADAVDSALRAPTKGEAVRYWRKVFGSSFGG